MSAILSRQHPSHDYTSSPAEDLTIPSPASRPPSNTGVHPLSTARERKIPPAQAPSSIKDRVQAARTISPARSDDDGSEQAEPQFSWLGRPPSFLAEKFGHDGGGDESDHRDGSAPTPTLLGTAAAAAAALSPSDQRRLVAVALDRMGAAVVEVRDAFQRWVPREEQAVAVAATARSNSSPTRRSKNKRAVSFSSQEMAAGSSLDNKTNVSTSKEAMMNAMAELRLPPATAEIFCEGAGGGDASATITFSDFVGRYAAASGLLKEPASSGKVEGGDVWVEGSGGVWVAVPFKKCADARKIFDGKVAKSAGDRNKESKSDDVGKITLSCRGW